MALSLRILGPSSVGEIPAFEFYPGEEVTIRLQVYDLDSDDAVAIPDGAVKELCLASSPTPVEIADADIDVDALDKSIFTAVLSEADTTAMTSGVIKFVYDDSGVTRIAVKEMGIKRLNTVL